MVMPQQILLGAAFGEAARGLLRPLAGGAPLRQAAASASGADGVLGERVEQRAMRRRVEQAALLALALDLDEAVAELAQQPDAGRLVVDEGAAAAVGRHQPAQHDRAGEVGRDAGLAQNRRGRMVVRDGELGGDRGLLGAGAHQAGIGAPPERQPERIEQDRLAGAGLAGQDAQPRPEGERQPVDQNDIADRDSEQHSGRVTR